MRDVRLSVGEDERGVLLRELDGFLQMSAALYRQIGREWDPADRSSLPGDVAPIVRVRDQLAREGDGPWQIEGAADELELLLGRLRAGAELALQRSTQPSPGSGAAAMHTADAEGTDTQLDILRVSDALMQQIRSSPDR